MHFKGIVGVDTGTTKSTPYCLGVVTIELPTIVTVKVQGLAISAGTAADIASEKTARTVLLKCDISLVEHHRRAVSK